MKTGLAYLAVILIWSTTPLAVKLSTDSLSFIVALGARMGLAAMLCLLLCQMQGIRLRWDRAALLAYLAANIGAVGAMSGVYFAVGYIPSGLVSVIFGLAPLLSGVFGYLILGQSSLSIMRVAALILSLIGLAIVFDGAIRLDQSAWPGLLSAMLAVAFFSLSGVLVKRQSAGMRALEHTTGSLLISLPAYLVLWLLVDRQIPGTLSPTSAASVLYLAVLGSVAGFMLYFYVLQELGPTEVALIPLITPVFALALGNLVADESVSARTLIGGALILLALAAYQADKRVMRCLNARGGRGASATS